MKKTNTELMSNTDNIKTYAVIPAAGSGQRFDETHSLPKQYTNICDKPLIYHTISSFLRIKWIDKIIVVSDSPNMQFMADIIDTIYHQNRVELVIGSTTRHRSISIGIESIATNSWPQPDIVVIHDGARPIIEEKLVVELVSNALEYGASGIICKLTSTILSVSEDQFMERALDRTKYYASETPQAFKYEYIREAYIRCSEDDFEFNTECLDLVKRYTSSKVKLIEVSPSKYFKVTFKKDVYGAEGILRDKKDVLLQCDFQNNFEVDYRFINDLRENLTNTFTNVEYFSNTSSVKFAYNPLIVRILMQFCNSLSEIFEKCVSKCDSFIYVIITNEQTNNYFNQEINVWVKNKTLEIKNFYAIHTTVDNLAQNRDRIIKTVMYLSKQTPIELSGQVFFM